MRFQRLLTRSVRGLWITSYSFGLRLFDQYVLRMVSQSPLNAVVLADREKLAEVWRNLPEGEEYLAKQAGRRYLLRGVSSAGGGAFHPKTYLFARAKGATLLVGSGNLSRGGIDRGHEVFASFDSDRPADLPTMRAWAEWMARLVEQEDDAILARRWLALREESPWMTGSREGSVLLTNDQEPMIEQLVARLRDRVAELHVTAPFFDREAAALRELIRRCSPECVELYVGAGVNVHGPALAAALDETGSMRVRRYEPHSFVHAKLIGAVEGDGRGLLLAGSPNLSAAALLGVCTEAGGGNWEAAVLREGTGEQVREAFEGDPRLSLAELSREHVEAFEFEEDERPAAAGAHLRSAIWRDDGRIAISCSALAGLPADAVMAWAGGSQTAALDGQGVTVEPLTGREPLPLLVWLAAADGDAFTNKVPVDDPAALEETLLGNRKRQDTRPAELQGIEDAPLIRIALWANDKFIFDLDREPAFHRAQDAIEAEEVEEASDFWERYAKEELRYDPRSQSYRPLTPGAGELAPIEELLRELQTMLNAAPGQPHPPLRILTEESIDGEGRDEEETATGSSWSMEARQRRRAYNLFMRWSQAVADPRHMLLSPTAPVVNYETLLAVISTAWAHDALEPKQLRKLLLTLLTAFIGADRRQPGFLGRVEEHEREEALGRLDPFAREIAAGLAAVALASHWRAAIYEWQPMLRRGIDLDVLLAGEWSVRVVKRLLGKDVDVDWIYALLRQRIEFVDEDTWCQRVAAELGFDSISLDLHRTAKVRFWVFVRGAGNPLHDPRLLGLVRRFLAFKDVPAVALEVGENNVMIFEPGGPARAQIDGVRHRSREPVTLTQLEEVERQGGSWADLLGTLAAAA
jgi:hypothetical protein